MRPLDAGQGRESNAGEDKETRLDVEACGVLLWWLIVVLEGELSVCAAASRQAADRLYCVGARVMAEGTMVRNDMAIQELEEEGAMARRRL